MNNSPAETVESLVSAINARDLKAAMTLYQEDAQFYVQPDIVVQGKESIESALSEMIAIFPTLKTKMHCVVKSGNTALYMSDWEMSVAGENDRELLESGSSVDVLVRSDNGRWYIAIDNPWGSRIIGKSVGKSIG